MENRLYKSLSIFLVVLMILAASPSILLDDLFAVQVFADDYSGECGDNLTWSLDTSNGLLTISGVGAMTEYEYPAVTPWNIHSFKIKSVTISSGVTSISQRAFYNLYLLTSVTIPDSVTSIREYAFHGCYALTSIVIPSGVTTIGNFAFANSGVASVAMSDSVTKIGIEAFYRSSIYSDESNWEDSVLYIGKYLICAKDSITDGYKIKEGTLTIADFAFRNCRNLKNITIPGSVKSIGRNAFNYCTYLNSITIPDSVTRIDEYAFSNCERLTDVTIGNSIKSIGDHAFEYCIALESIVIPDSVTQMGKGVFNNCHNLKSIKLSNSITSIPENLFGNCDRLNNVTIPNSVKSIGENAFYGCGSLSVVIVPDSVKSIAYNAFTSSLIYQNTSNWVDGVLYIGNHLIKAKSYVFNDYTLNPGTITVVERAFEDCEDTTSVTIPSSVTSIGRYAFGYYYNSDIRSLVKIDGFKVYCYKGTAGEQYAKDNRFEYELLEADAHSGDVDGNGKIDATDYILVKRHILNVKTLNGDSFDAADMDSNGKLDSTDYIQIKRIMLGID